MDFRKKLKIRLFVAISYIILGLALIVTYSVLQSANEFLSSYGLALIVIGAVRIRNYFVITKNDESIKRQQIKETDERNIAIANRAKSISFLVSVLAASVAIIILEILNLSEIAAVLSVTLCAMLLIHYITYWIVRKNS